MKRNTLAILSILLLIGCSQNKTYKTAVGLLSHEGRKSMETIEKFEKLIPASNDLKNDQVRELMTSFSDYIVIYSEQITDSLNDILNNEYTVHTEAAIDSIGRALEIHGLNLYMVEGYIEVSVSPIYIADIFKHYLSDAEYNFAIIAQHEIDEPSLMDAGIIVSYQEIADRLWECEKLVATCEDTVVAQNIMEYQRLYTTLLMIGSDNTPAFDWKSKKFSQDILDVINNYIIEHPETPSAKVLSQYNSILQTTDYTESDASHEFVMKYVGL